MPKAVISPLATISPVDVILKIVVVPYLIIRLAPDCSTVKSAVDNVPALLAESAAPLISISQVPVALVPSALGAPTELYEITRAVLPLNVVAEAAPEPELLAVND